MNLYLDDNRAGPRLAGLLVKAGHTVVRPAEVGLSGAWDPRHLEHAIRMGLAVLTADQEDFQDLDRLIQIAGGRHCGMLVVRYDNDPRRDMKPQHIVAAVGKLERSGALLANQVVILNQWRQGNQTGDGRHASGIVFYKLKIIESC
jgi:hypothetical protein